MLKQFTALDERCSQPGVTAPCPPLPGPGSERQPRVLGAGFSLGQQQRVVHADGSLQTRGLSTTDASFWPGSHVGCRLRHFPDVRIQAGGSAPNRTDPLSWQRRLALKAPACTHPLAAQARRPSPMATRRASVGPCEAGAGGQLGAVTQCHRQTHCRLLFAQSCTPRKEAQERRRSCTPAKQQSVTICEAKADRTARGNRQAHNCSRDRRPHCSPAADGSCSWKTSRHRVDRKNTIGQFHQRTFLEHSVQQQQNMQSSHTHWKHGH